MLDSSLKYVIQSTFNKALETGEISVYKDVVIEKDDEKLGVDIIKEAIKEPFKKMVSNAGFSPDIYLEKIENHTNPDSGFDATTGDIVNMFTYGIIDPFKVVRCALENAASAASTLLLTDHAIVEE